MQPTTTAEGARQTMATRRKSADWLTLATATLRTRDSLRRVLPVIEALLRQTAGDMDRTRMIEQIRAAVATGADTLRIALKDRAHNRSRSNRV
jgi:acyl-CoA synthetase (AMP-forming)/AMP-acid ligase II